MEYKVLHSADLEADLNEAAAEGWKLFRDPQQYRVPHSPAIWLVVLERGAKADPEAEANGVTLATIRDWANQHSILDHPDVMNDHARGYTRAVKDVRAILKVHGTSPGTPVHFGES